MLVAGCCCVESDPAGRLSTERWPLDGCGGPHLKFRGHAFSNVVVGNVVQVDGNLCPASSETHSATVRKLYPRWTLVLRSAWGRHCVLPSGGDDFKPLNRTRERCGLSQA